MEIIKAKIVNLLDNVLVLPTRLSVYDRVVAFLIKVSEYYICKSQINLEFRTVKWT